MIKKYVMMISSLTFLTLAGCATTWKQSGGSTTSLQSSHKACMESAYSNIKPYHMVTVGTEGIFKLFGSETPEMENYRKCMEANGWYKKS